MKASVKQRGAALIIGLIFLVLMSIIGLTSMQNVNIQERVSGNTVDSNRTMMSAELFLATMERKTISNTFAASHSGYIHDAPNNSDLFTDDDLLDPASWDNCDTVTIEMKKRCKTEDGGLVKYEKLGSREYRITIKVDGKGSSSVILQSSYKKI